MTVPAKSEIASGTGTRHVGLVSEIDIRRTLSMLWRRRWMIAAILALSVVGSWLFVSRIEPVYTATTQVMIDSRRTRIVDIKEVLSQLSPQLVTVTSEVEVIRSRALAQRVSDTLDLYKDPEFNPRLRPQQESRIGALVEVVKNTVRSLFGGGGQDTPPTPADERENVVSRVHGGLSVSVVPQSMVIQLSYQSTSPHTASRLANAFAEAYIAEQLEAKFEAIRYATSWLNDRLASLRQTVGESERAVNAYRAEHNIQESRGQPANQQKLGELTTQLIALQARRVEQEARLARVEQMRASGAAGALRADELLDSPLVLKLKEQEATLAREASEMASRYGDRHPQMVKVKAELEEITARINTEINKLASGLRSDVAVLRDREAGLSGQIRALETNAFSQNTAEVRLRELEREAQANRAIYETFLTRFKETGEQERIQQADSRIISLSTPPKVPSYPRKGAMVLGAAIVGLILAVALAMIIEQFDNTFRSGLQVEQYTGVPALGLIPEIRNAGADVRVESYVVDKPESSYAEAYRIAWFAAKHAANAPDPQVLVITSSVPEEGKSLTALSMARTASGLGLKTILIDADLRRASIASKMGIQPEKTIAKVLTGEITLADAVMRDPISGLDVLPGIPSNRRVIDLLRVSDELRALVETLRKNYDIIIIDSPPALSVADIQMLARLADATLFCVRWDATPRESVQAALRSLQDHQVQLSGILLTRVNVQRHASYGHRDIGYYYGRYHSYYTE
ncbi:GumC family protein [Niveispirillum sp. KHB5.9]|uniref:GumC family protein n=1 Tax=Niveispirillum sp. KHB5.9 TaxID=3400269 RepID=UPI003A858782